MAASFTHVFDRLDRAKEHIPDVERGIEVFLESKPYEVVTENDPQTGKRVSKLASVRDDSAVPLLIGEVVHGIRASLDNFVYAAVPNPTTNTAFPVWRPSRTPTQTDLDALVKAKADGASQGLTSALRALETYPGGNAQDIWLVDHLDIVDKHRLLLTVGAFLRSYRFRGTLPGIAKNFPVMPVIISTHHEPRIEVGDELIAIPFEHIEEEDEPSFTFRVAFGEPKVLVGQPVVPTLSHLADVVESLLKKLVPLV